MSKTILIIQARLGSSRFPSKVLLPIKNKPSIIYQYNRIKNCNYIKNIIVAIPDNKENDLLDEILRKENIPVFRGNENNVFNRFINCADLYKAENIIRINGDCPLISPKTIECIVNLFNENLSYDYLSTTLDESFPIGEHVEIFKLSSIKKAALLNLSSADMEHVTPVFYNNNMHFKTLKYESKLSYPKKLRLCIDYPEDYEFISKLVNYFPDDYNFELEDIINIVNKHPELMDINSFYNKSRTIRN